ncbi:MAG: ROK family protein [Tractidigestivibacter sp.]|jgi:glucokinase|uniref:ROK family protein n=1 Tax=Tractidigestivibacter sp. TaxID=2847320 RepID=UPI003D947A87
MSDTKKRIVALDIGGTKIASALVTLEPGEKPVIEFVGKVPTEAKKGGEKVLANAIASARRVVDAAGGTVDGIGVSSAGVIDPKTGDVTYANEIMPGWGGTHLGAELEAAFGVPARIMNDVHAHALGEARWGGGREAGSCLVVAVGTGIGGAFVNNGKILLGAHNEAGHIGHVSCSDAIGVPCSCGATGHLEPIAAGPGIIDRYIELGGNPRADDGSDVDGAVIDQRAAAGDQAAIAAEERSGHAIGEVLGSMCNMFDPDCIILSGSVAQCGDAWHNAMKRGWDEAVMPPVASTPVVSGELGGDAPLIGAAENVVSSGYAEFE